MPTPEERGDEITFTGTTPVVRTRQSGMARSTLISFQGTNPNGEDESGANDRTVIIRKRKNGVQTAEWSRFVPAGKTFAFDEIAVLDAADEELHFLLSGTGTWGGDAMWLDRASA